MERVSLAGWPKDSGYRQRFVVPDLSPEQRPQLKLLSSKLVFVAESPHESEVSPENKAERRPLCGRAGREWWQMIGELLLGESSQAVDLERLIKFCQTGQFAVMNAVQYPMDPKITAYYGEESNPSVHLGFSKAPQESFKKRKNTFELHAALELLRKRLNHSSLKHCPVVSLGNDSQWFVTQAIGAERLIETVPHPSAWWRKGGFFRRKARDQLTELLFGLSAREVDIQKAKC